MMFDKPTALLIYGMVGLGLAAAVPTLSKDRLFGYSPGFASNNLKESGWIAAVMFVLSLLILAKLHGYLSWWYIYLGAILSCFSAVLSARENRMSVASAMFLGILLASVIPWWLRGEDQHLKISGYQSALMLLITSASYWMLTRGYSQEYQDTPNHRRIRSLIYVGFALAICYFVLSTGLALTTASTAVWHHWGAYIGPAQLVAAGALPLHDIPLQYGLGPTLLLALGCKVNCWTSLYWISGACTLVMLGLLAWLAIKFNRSMHPLAVIATLVVILTCGLLWTAYPPSLMASMATPSTTGIRFLPGVLVLAWLVNQTRLDNPLNSYATWGHLLWLGCILWSPEAGFHATALWAPYFVWNSTFNTHSDKPDGSLITRFIRSNLTLAMVLVVGLGFFAVAYRVAYGVWPLPDEYVAYVIHPPGPLPINPLGTIWFAVACMACWIASWALTPRGATRTGDARASWLSALLCLATFTYYLGRSHDNNILNLLPYLALLLFAARAVTSGGALHTLATTLLAALLGWSTAFGGTNYDEAHKEGRLLAFTPQELVDSFNRETDRGLFYMAPQAREMHLHPGDAVPALKYIRNNYHEPVEIFDLFMLVDGGEVYEPWNALHGPENFVFIPSERRRIYLERVAKRLHKPGWVLYEQSADVVAFLSEYDSVYSRTNEHDFGTYKAIRYVPR